MKFYVIKPQVAGSFGELTEFDLPVPPRKVVRLHYVFDCWPDKLVKKIMAYAVENELMIKLQSLGVSGIEFCPCVVSKGDQFYVASPEHAEPLPIYLQMNIFGEVGKDDFGLKQGIGLVVSERVKKIIESTNPTDCIIEEYIQ